MPKKSFILAGLLMCTILTTTASAATVNLNADIANRAAFDAAINNDDDIVITGNMSITIDDATPTERVKSITVNSGVTLTVNFTANGTITLEDQTGDGNTAIAVSGTMTVSGANGKFSFANAANKKLSVTGTIGGDVGANTLEVGNNELETAGTASVYNVTLGGANAQLDINHGTTVRGAVTMGGAAVANVATGVTLTGTLDVNANTLSLNEASGGTIGTVQLDTAGGVLDVNESCTVTNTNLTANASIKVAQNKVLTSTVDVNGNTLTLDEANGGGISTVLLDTAGGILDVNENVTITTLTQSANASIRVANGKVLTATADVNGNTLVLDEANGGTLTAIQLDTSGGIVDVNESCTVTGITLTANATLQVANGKTLTATVDVNGNTLTLNEANGGTISTVSLDTSGATLDVNESVTIAATAMTSNATLQVAGGKTLTTTVDVNGNTLTVSETGAITTVNVDTDGATLDINESCAINSIGITGDTDMKVASGKTLTSTVTVGAATLTLTETGVPGSIQLNNTDAILDVNTSVTPTALTLNADAKIDVAAGQTLTSNVNISTRNLTLIGSGTVSQVTGTTGTLTVDGTNTITTLTPSPGSSGTFTYSGTGESTVTTLTALDGNSEKFKKAGTGTLTLTNGFSFAGATGVMLEVSAGKLVDVGGNDITFGDNSEKITVANGATFTTASSMTANNGTATQLDGQSGSTIVFNKSGVVTLTSTVNDDFKFLGTTNIENGCTVQLAGAFQTQWGNVNIRNTGNLTNTVASSSMLFVPSTIVVLEGTGSGTLFIDGQDSTTPIVLTTTTGSGTFTINRGSSSSLTLRNIEFANCTYASTAGGYADAEITLVNVVDKGNTTKWFSPLSADAGDDVTIISGNSTMLAGSAGGGTPPYTYSWSPTAGLDDATSASPTATPTATTTYTLTVVDAAGATANDTMTVTVNPVLSADAGADVTIDSGESTVLAGAASGGSGVYAYNWSPVTGLSNANIATPTATPTVTTTYTLTVTDLGDGNKTATAQVTVTVGGGASPIGCGAGLLGAGAAPLLPLTLLTFVGWSCCRRRRRA